MVTITEEAITALNEVLKSQEKKGQRLRIFIASMTCSGIAYGLSLDEDVSETDKTKEINGIQIVYDEELEKTIEPLIISYIDDGYNKGFTVEDPNAVQCNGSCAGCH